MKKFFYIFYSYFFFFIQLVLLRSRIKGIIKKQQDKIQLIENNLKSLIGKLEIKILTNQFQIS